MNYNKPTSTQAGANTADPQPISGVEMLNHTLGDVIGRINRVAGRVGSLANQFGCAAIEENVPPVKAPENTNDLMGEINDALRSLERITSRIDNQ